jgi:hypothetical protein
VCSVRPIFPHEGSRPLEPGCGRLCGIARCIVVPVYREQPEPFEVVSLTQLAWRLGEHPIELIAPAGLDLSPYQRLLGERRHHYFDPSFFTARADSRASYSALMVSDVFYGRFVQYEHVLVHQTDAFVFEDQLERWATRDFDYIGSPHWADWGARKDLGMIGVGNGGFSLRRVEPALRVLKDGRRFRNRIQLAIPRSHARALRRARNGALVEDYYWGHFSPIRVASIPEAIAFAFEMGLEQMADDYRDLIPFGCHAVWNLDYIADYRRGKPQHREPEYERVLYSILERSGNA